MRLELDGLTGLSGVPVALAEVGVLQAGEQLPELAADDLGGGRPDDALGGAVHVGQPPLAIDGGEARGHRLDQPGCLLARRVHLGDVVRGPQQAYGDTAVLAGQGSTSCRQPALVPLGQQHAVLGTERSARLDRRTDGQIERRSVVRVDPAEALVHVGLDGAGGVAEQGLHPRVPVQPTGGQVHVERADLGRLDRHLPPQPTGFELDGQRLQLELGHDRARELLQQRDVLRRPAARGRAEGAQRTHDVPAVNGQWHPEVGPDRPGRHRCELGHARVAAGVLDHQRATLRDGDGAQRVRCGALRPDHTRGQTAARSDRLHVGQQRHLHRDRRLRGRQQPLRQVGEPIQRRQVTARGQQSRRGDPVCRQSIRRPHPHILPWAGPSRDVL